MTTPETPPPPGPSRARRALRLCERVLAVCGALLLVWHAGFDLVEVTTTSMRPTLTGDGLGAPGNDWILYERVSTRLAAPPRMHFLVLRDDEGMVIVKRVVAHAGDRVRIVDGQVEVNGERFAHPAPGRRWLGAGVVRRGGDGEAPRAYEVPDGGVFVLGDDAADSWDSRFTGAVDRSRWAGRPMAIVWPPARMRWLW